MVTEKILPDKLNVLKHCCTEIQQKSGENYNTHANKVLILVKS